MRFNGGVYLALARNGLVHRCHPAKSVSLTVARVEMARGLPGSFQSPQFAMDMALGGNAGTHTDASSTWLGARIAGHATHPQCGAIAVVLGLDPHIVVSGTNILNSVILSDLYY